MIFQTLLDRLKKGDADFEDVIAHVNDHYEYTPTRFTNGLGADPVVNEAGKNEGSCRLFALAKVKGLGSADTVQLFGRFYRDDVLKHPDGSDHANRDRGDRQERRPRRNPMIAADGFDFSKPYEDNSPRGDVPDSPKAPHKPDPHKPRKVVAALLGGIGKR